MEDKKELIKQQIKDVLYKELPFAKGSVNQNKVLNNEKMLEKLVEIYYK